MDEDFDMDELEFTRTPSHRLRPIDLVLSVFLLPLSVAEAVATWLDEFTTLLASHANYLNDQERSPVQVSK